MSKVTFIVVFFLNICFAQTFSKEKVFELGINNEFLFVELSDIKIINSNIYLTDKKGITLYKFNTDGKLLKSIGNKGKGPSEFYTGPNEIGLLNNKIVISDGNGNSVMQYFDKNLNFIERKSPKFLFDRFETFNNEVILFRGDFDNNEIITKCDSNFNFVKKLHLPNLSDFTPENRINFIFDYKGTLISYFKRKNLIEIYNREYKLINQFSVPNFRSKCEFEILKSVKKSVEKRMKPKMASYFYHFCSYSIISSAIPDFSNRIFIQGASYSKLLKRMVYVFTYEGKLLGEFELDKDERIMAIDKHNHLYTFAEDRTVLKKYKILFEGKN